jgi:hypothetical protein
MKFIEKKGKYGSILEADSSETYFVAYYDKHYIEGGGLDISSWSELDDGIVKLKYIVSNGKIIDIPRYKAYLHLIEASMSVDKNTSALYSKNYHYVYIKGFTGDKVITHRISLRGKKPEEIGSVVVYEDDVSEINNYKSSWVKGK